MAQSIVQTSNRITGSRKWWALATVLLTMFFSSMDQTVVSNVHLDSTPRAVVQ